MLMYHASQALPARESPTRRPTWSSNLALSCSVVMGFSLAADAVLDVHVDIGAVKPDRHVGFVLGDGRVAGDFH